jgi:hypothetical protein
MTTHAGWQLHPDPAIRAGRPAGEASDRWRWRTLPGITIEDGPAPRTG